MQNMKDLKKSCTKNMKEYEEMSERYEDILYGKCEEGSGTWKNSGLRSVYKLWDFEKL